MTEKNDILPILLEMSATQREFLVTQNMHQKVLDRVCETMEETNRTLLRNTITVEEHHKRSNLLEQELRRIEIDLSSLKVSDTDLQDIKSHVATVAHTKQIFKSLQTVTRVSGYVFGCLSTLAGLFWGLYEIAKKMGF